MGVAANNCGKKIKPDLIKDLTDIIDLIPVEERAEVIAKHMFTDLKCMKAFEYTDSKEFKQLMQQAMNLQEITDILMFLHALNDSSNGIEYNDFLQYYDMEYIIIDVPIASQKVEMGFQAVAAIENPAAESQNLQDFVSFVHDLLQHFPRDKYVQMVKDKRAKSTNFDLSYTAARSRDLRPKVEQALKAPNVMKILQQLAAHYIDVNSLVPIVFDVLSWGPPATNKSTFKYTTLT